MSDTPSAGESYDDGFAESLVTFLEKVHQCREFEFDCILGLIVFERLLLKVSFCPDLGWWWGSFLEGLESPFAFLDGVGEVRGRLIEILKRVFKVGMTRFLSLD